MYNKAPFIERMVKSISEQTYLPRTKIIVVDDCSTDDSVEILKNSAEKFHVPMILQTNRVNIGLSLTIRDLNRRIDTPFFTVLDPDDYYVMPDRFERAVEFLKSHPDYSMHACNYFRENPNGERESAFPQTLQNISISNYQNMPLFAVAGATFRNFYTPELLLEVDRLAGKSRFHLFDLDAFRHFVAVHFGKVYLDNFIGAVYSVGVGIWDNLTQIEKDVLNMCCNYELFKFARDFLHNAQTANFCLNSSYALYVRVIDEVSSIMKNLSSQDFHASNYSKNVLRLKTGNIAEIMNVIFEQNEKFLELGIKPRK